MIWRFIWGLIMDPLRGPGHGILLFGVMPTIHVSMPPRSNPALPKGNAILLSVLFLLSVGPWAEVMGGDSVAQGRESTPWHGDDSGWIQFQHTPSHNSSMPAHGPNGGAGDGNISELEELGTIAKPTVNWNSEATSSLGADGYGATIGDFSNSITAPDSAAVRCGDGHQFAVIVVTENSGGDDRSVLKIIEGDTSKTAWRIDLGITNKVKATPIIYDIDGDQKPEIIIAYDTQSELVVDVWSPELTCSEAGWQTTGHTTELLWSWQDSDRRIGIESPHIPVESTGHLVSTQPLLADLEMDGSPEIVLAAIDQDTSNPVVIALPLPNQGPPEAMWSVALDRGTHISDPAWVALDSLNSALLVTTIDSTDANMWVWKIDGGSGSLDWERVTLPNGDTDSDSPRLRLPGPVIAQLDDDEIPEVIFTIPTDGNGRTSGSGATLVAWELTATEEIWSFRTPNGYSDAPPLPVDTDGDGIHDRVCWVTWYSTSQWNFDRQGMVGCHDLTTATPTKEWHRTLEQGAGNDNDEIAASPPIWLDIDGFGAPEIVVSFGRRIFAFDGDTGLQADINSDWADALDVPHRVWVAPAVGDLDGDGYIDLLYGDTLVSHGICDVAPTSDGRGLAFNPEAPNPNETVTITAQFANVGTDTCDTPIDAVLYVDDVEIGRYRSDELEPIAPSGDAGPTSFSVDITALLGISQVRIELDPHGNLSQSRRDNDAQSTELFVVKPYDAEFSIPSEPLRISPGSSGVAEPIITSTGRSSGNWQLTVDSSNLPENWTVSDETSGGIGNVSIDAGNSWTPNLRITVPSIALGDDSGHLVLTLVLLDDTNISLTAIYPVEVLRTRGLSILGPEGVGQSHGIGQPSHDAIAWLLIENLGNAADSTTTMSWDSNTWSTSPSLRDMDGTEHHIVHLDPGEQAYYAAHLPVPGATPLGQSTTTSLELCVGSGADKICETIYLKFTANAVSSSPPHHRVTPDESISYRISSTNSGQSWDMQDAGMFRPLWQWSAGGDFTIINGELQTTASGANEGWLNLSMPAVATPQLHVFNMSAENGGNNDLNLSLQVLQVHRADISIIEPTSSPVIWTVGDEHTVVIRLANTGNGADDYQLNALVIANENFSSDPGLSFNLYDPIKSISAGALQTALVGITLPLDMPARTGLLVELELLSLGNTTISDRITLVIEAEPDHRWNITSLNPQSQLVDSASSVELSWQVENIGNYVDDINLTLALTNSYFGNDQSGWSTTVSGTDMLDVGQSSIIRIMVEVPEQAWNGTSAEINVSFNSSAFIVGSDLLSLEVQRNAGWSFDISQSSLEVLPTGRNITVKLIQQGNKASIPYITGSMYGWNVSFPTNLSAIEPFSQTELLIYATPPESALAGEVGELLLISQDGDGLGEVQAQIPLRVGAVEACELLSIGHWKVSQEGGFPLAWLENTGNSRVDVYIDLEDIPVDWTLSGSGVVSIAAGQSSGLPIELIPPQNWDNESLRVTITAELNGVIEKVNITVVSANLSWATSPFLTGVNGDQHEIQFHGMPSSSSGNTAVSQENSRWWVKLSSPGGEKSVDIANSEYSETLAYFVEATTIPSRQVSCDFITTQVNSLGSSTYNSSSPLAHCSVDNGSADFRATISIVSSSGTFITSTPIYVLAEEEGEFNVTAPDWIPQVGIWTLTLTVIESSGAAIEESSSLATIRATGWNIGISVFDETTQSGEDKLRIGITRTNYQIMTAPDCKVHLSSNEWQQELIVDVTASGFAPELIVERPDELSAGDEITALLTCLAPWDMDDDSNDDSSTLILSQQSSLTEEVGGLIWAGGVSFLLLAVLWKLNILWPQEEITRRKRKSRKSAKGSAQSNEREVVVEADDETLEIVNDDEVNEEQGTAANTGISESPDDMQTEPAMNPAPPSSIMSKYRRSRGDDSGSDIDSRIDQMLRRKELE